MGVKVIKFGGSSVADADQLRKIKAIVEADPERHRFGIQLRIYRSVLGWL